MAVIDLYSGIGGWTLGFKMAGVPVLSSYEWWKDANQTHNKNFGSDHAERDIRKLTHADLPDPALIDFVVGSPPCTQFSLANRGGKGDIADGLVDIKKFLEVVEYLQPRYWAMENVPRVAGILAAEIAPGGSLEQFAHLFDDIRVYKASDFGVPQDRKRMIAGRFPFDLFESYAGRTPKLNLGDVLHALEQDPMTDPVYDIVLPRELVTDHILEPNLSAEEERINRDTKTYHPVYNAMSFPDRIDRPSRTVTALCTRVSRESIIIRDSQNNLRRLTIRERGCLQSFPINYQYFSKTYAGKIKMIGNAVPPLLTFYIAQSMLGTPLNELVLPKNVIRERLVLGTQQAISHQPDNEGANYSASRSFWLAIPGLRFGSGVRFELKNAFNKVTKEISWSVNFFYGNSKNIKGHKLDSNLFHKAVSYTNLMEDDQLSGLLNRYLAFIRGINTDDLQKNWTNKDRGVTGPIYLTDQIGVFATSFKDHLRSNETYVQTILSFVEAELTSKEGKVDNKKLIENSADVFIGILLGAGFNAIVENTGIELAPPALDPVLA
jgi:DNA (cytosine-5)-methyltransferase 1